MSQMTNLTGPTADALACALKRRGKIDELKAESENRRLKAEMKLEKAYTKEVTAATNRFQKELRDLKAKYRKKSDKSGTKTTTEDNRSV